MTAFVNTQMSVCYYGNTVNETSEEIKNERTIIDNLRQRRFYVVFEVPEAMVAMASFLSTAQSLPFLSYMPG